MATSPNKTRQARGVRTALFQHRLKAICDEMALTLYQTTRSPLFNQGDFAVGFMDPAGNMLEQDEHLALMAFSLFPGCQAIRRFFGDAIDPGDVFIHNDVWYGNLQHADTGLYKPIFVDGRLVAWVGCRGHWADIGGAVKGTANPDATEVWQEALRITPLKIVERGEPRRDVWELIFANVRLREIVEADARAQLGACTLGERRLQRLVAKMGLDAFREDTELLFDAGERMMRQEIDAIPDGRYIGESFVYDDSAAGVERTRIQVAVEVRGQTIALDYTGTDPQQPNFMNAPYVSAASAALVTLLSVIDPLTPHNAGTLRPIQITIPEGSLLNARFPAATFAGNKLCEHNSEALMRALAQAVPERVTASWARRLSYRLTGRDPRTERGFHDVLFMTYGGGGAAHGADGYNQPGLMGGGNVLHQDYELFELQNPVILEQHEYRPDSAGAGEWRGGIGNQTTIRYYGHDTLAVTHGDGTVEGPGGLFGGGRGQTNSTELRYPDGRVERMHARDRAGPLPVGTVSHHLVGGGGGFGDPLRRPIGRVIEDVRNGFVSPEVAREVYGVEIDPETWRGLPTRARRERSSG